MAEKETIKKLKDLLQLDVDASHAYKQAIEKIDTPSIREQLANFRNDHERHIRDLAAKLQELGEDVPKPTPDLKGMLIEGFTALRSMTGTEGALKAMRSNEKLTNRKYDEGRKIAATTDVQALIEQNYQDEVRHLAYIENALNTRAWER